MVSEQTLAAQTETSAKKNFLARISHELRTPLSGIIGLSALARKNLTHDKEEPLIKGLEESARHLLDTTNMLLDHARIDAGKWPVNPTGFALREMLQDIIEQHRTAAGYKSLSINSAVQQNVPDHITTDQDIVRRILDYIINNAIKFTHDGGITVMAEASSNDPATATIRIDILDTGVGFDELFKARAFELFELADMSTTRNQQGFGLGLSLSKKLCELLGGEIGCDSNPRHGTVFWFTFPCRIDSRAAANTYKEQQRASSPASKTTDTSMARRVQRRREQQADQLLVAEDDEALQMIISAMLDKLHQHHTVFPHGKPLLSTYQRHHEKVAALLLDWNMPVCNAEETITKIRRFETENRLDPVPVIIMSAYDRHSARELHLPDDISILQKPVTIDDLAYLLFPDEKNVP